MQSKEAINNPRVGRLVIKLLVLVMPIFLCALPNSIENETSSLDSLLNIEVSTASKYKQSIRNVPARAVIVTDEEITNFGYETIADVLNSLPGFYSSNDRNYTYTGVRGFSRPTDYNNRLLVLIDGHKLNELYFGSASTGTEYGGIDLSIIERIEVIYGPGSVLYGTGAMFAVINLITKEGKAIDGVELSAKFGSLGYNSGSFSFGKQVSDQGSIIFNIIGGKSEGENLYFKEYDDPETDSGFSKGLDGDNYFGSRLELSYFNFSLSILGATRTKHIPTAAWEMAFNQGDPLTRDDHFYIGLHYDKNLGASRSISADLSGDYYYEEGMYAYLDEDYLYYWEELTETIGYSGELRFLWDISVQNRLVTGIDIQSAPRAFYMEWDEWETYFELNNPFNVISLYVQDEYQFNQKILVNTGLRFDNYSHVGNFATPRLAIIYKLNRNTIIKSLYGKAYRVPTIAERNYFDLDVYKENLDLKPETMITKELIFQKMHGRKSSSTLSVYRNNISGLINLVADDDGVLFNDNIDNVSTWGMDYGYESKLNSNIEMKFNISRQNTINELDGSRLSNSPALLAKGMFNYRIRPSINMAVELHYEDSRITIYETETEPYILTNLSLVSGGLLSNLELAFKVHNVFDTYYETPGGWEHLMPGIPGYGRTFKMSISYK